MTFEEKVAAAKRLLASKGVWRASYAPTIVAFLWRLGVHVPPPHFAGFVPTFVFAAAVFGTAWGVIMWTIYWSTHGVAPIAAVAYAAGVGAVVGLAMAAYYRYSARRLALPSWNEFFPSSASGSVEQR